MADLVKTVQSVKAYCTTVCQENELRGFRPVRKGLRFHKTVAGIRRTKMHVVHRAAPMTVELLEKIED